ncbi:MAG: hypothetical protein ACYDAR_14025 [Thermomicrobiales bacterium]
MVNMNTVRQPPPGLDENEKRIWEEEERAMRELLASLPLPPSLEELARAQGVRIPRRWEDLIPDWPEGEWDDEEDFDDVRHRWKEEQLMLEQERYARLFPDDNAT